MPINLQCMSLDWGRKPEYPEETPKARGEHANSTHTAETGIEPPTLEFAKRFASTNGLSGYRYWDVNERSACWRSESVGLFIEPRAATRLARRAAAPEPRSGAETPTRASVLAYPKIEMETTSSMPTTQLAQGQCHLGRAERRQECALSNASQSRSRVLKRQRSNSPELLRCKRRLSFTGLGYSIPQQQPVAVARRNERERNRVKQVNMGFQTLRQHVPNGAANKKMSKVETLSYSADPESPHSSYSSDDGTYEHLSSEEQELLDFTTCCYNKTKERIKKGK
ncbi:hypothetical protein QTP86_003311 [Hemibagrus guttatus]|nr:hypothetical protein QTP86_003311 [Hemibagrus guttatus]